MALFKHALTLRNWFRFSAVGLLLLMALVLLKLAQYEWRDFHHAEEALAALSRLRAVLTTAEMVSRERGPAHLLLATPDPVEPAMREALRAARARTDQSLADARRLFNEGRNDSPERGEQAERLQVFAQALMRTRSGIDALLAQPAAERRAEDVDRAGHDILSLVPILLPLSAQVAADIQRVQPDVTMQIGGSRLASELRDAAGMLGALFTAPLLRGSVFTEPERAVIERTRAQVTQLGALLVVRVATGTHSAASQEARERMDQEYFLRGQQLVDWVITAGLSNAHYGMTPQAFAATYVPLMDAIVRFRDALLNDAEHRIVQSQARARDALAAAAVVVVTVLALVIVALRFAHVRFVAPLAQAAKALQAMGRGELRHPLPTPQGDDEIAAVIGGIQALREQHARRQELERERDKLIETLRLQSTTDFLTGLPNRRAFLDVAEGELARARRHGFPVVLMVLDVDHFKQVNDIAGHAAGDDALVAVAATLRGSMRQGDIAARFGGEEFVALLSHCEPDDGMRLAERLRQSIAERRVDRGHDLPPLPLTVSIGLANSRHHGAELRTLLARADDAMYQAKNAGRNRTIQHA